MQKQRKNPTESASGKRKKNRKRSSASSIIDRGTGGGVAPSRFYFISYLSHNIPFATDIRDRS
jgi:hypothetical protein